MNLRFLRLGNAERFQDEQPSSLACIGAPPVFTVQLCSTLEPPQQSHHQSYQPPHVNEHVQTVQRMVESTRTGVALVERRKLEMADDCIWQVITFSKHELTVAALKQGWYQHSNKSAIHLQHDRITLDPATLVHCQQHTTQYTQTISSNRN